MRALVLEEYGHLALREIAEPDVGPDEVLVAVEACGICGSDVHGVDGSTGRRLPPIVMGHEAAGVIAELGSGVSGWSVGDRVTFDSTISCGTCRFCRTGHVNLCENRRVLGVSCEEYRQDGAFAQYVAVPARICYRLPDDLPYERAALTEPLSVALHGISLGLTRDDESALVVGLGMIGQLAVRALHALGCGRVLAVDVDPGRAALAAALGVETIPGDAADATAAVLDRTGGLGVDLAVECVGNSAAVATAIGATRKGGRAVLIGNVSPHVDLPLQSVVTREVSLLGSCVSAGEFPRCIELLASREVDVDPLISAVAPLADGPDWFERLRRPESGLMKVVLEP